jgi:hyperosmotically inducible periplasmic protein
MNTILTTPITLNRTILAAAIGFALYSPVYAADSKPAVRHYDSTVDYAAYRDQNSSYTLRASEVIGRDVRNANDDKIGDIDDLIVSRDGGKVLAIVSLGGFFNLNAKLIAIPYQDLRVTQDGKYVYYNVSKEELQSRAEFVYAAHARAATVESVDDKVSKTGETARNEAAKVDSGQAAAGAKRAVTAEKSTAGTAVSESAPVELADNSARNERDSGGETLTPIDQSNAAADVEITRAIRQVLVDDSSLGTNAQNVKVITVDGTVTLRGAVASTAEHARIVAVAKEAAGLDRVQDELEVIQR